LHPFHERRVHPVRLRLSSTWSTSSCVTLCLLRFPSSKVIIAGKAPAYAIVLQNKTNVNLAKTLHWLNIPLALKFEP
jgi:hypothetical protein